MRVQPDHQGALQALNAVLQGIESVRNARALYLLLLAFAGSGLLMAMAQRALAAEAGTGAALWLFATFLLLFYTSNAAGLVLMDEACGRPARLPAQAIGDALRCGHRLLAVVAVVLVASALLLGLVLALLAASRLAWPGPALLGVVVPLAVPALGLAGAMLVMLVGPVAAPAVWSGLGVGAVLAFLWRQVRVRLPHALLFSAAVSLLTAAVAALVSAIVLGGGRVLLALAVLVLGIDIAPEPLLAALFGQGLRVPAGAPALSAATSAAVGGAGMVFALGLVLPGVVYLRGLCELFLALRRADAPPAP